MKTTIGILSVIFAIIFLSGCSNDTSINNTKSLVPYVLSGNIENWVSGGNIKLRAELYDTNHTGNYIVIDSNIVSINGAFSLNFIIPDDSMLYPINFTSDTSCIINISVNPPNTKTSGYIGLNLYTNSIQSGFIYRSNYINDTTAIPGQFFTYYIYMNQNVSITGSVICNHEPYIHDSVIYNITGYRGWNKIVVLYSSINNNSLKITISSNEPAGGKWFGCVSSDNTFKYEPSYWQKAFILNKCVPCK